MKSTVIVDQFVENVLLCYNMYVKEEIEKSFNRFLHTIWKRHSVDRLAFVLKITLNSEFNLQNAKA